ncbi:hypothetical protein PspLS_02386 [Pyricularia sp. CBS 133598]|nr:hypothetical protein PspLS_02386 [Pyricularia sp. CBS 133598]
MGCGGRKHQVEIRPEQKWEYISLNDFKSTSCLTPFAYTYLWISLCISMAVYGVDSFTAVQLLAFNQWPGQVRPAIDFDISKWIFAVCIILSFLNLGYEHVRAQKVIRRGSVAESYLDNLAVRLQSIRIGGGKGYKRFLVFAELTKSKKGAEYLALFTYFSFQSWFRVIVCSGPRQVVNAVTLYAFYQAQDLTPKGTDVGNTLLDFFNKIKFQAEQNPVLALILSGMVFTLLIWAIAMLALIAAVLCWVLFLWSYIPAEDGSLSNYCARKANKRLMAIVAAKVNKGIAEEERRRKKAELKAAKKAGERPPEDIKPTLPDVGDDKLPTFPSLSRADTMTTLPPYASRPGTPGSIELNSLDQKRPMPSRQGTMNSNYSSRQPLMGAAAEFGRSASPAPSIPSTNYSGRTYGGQPPMSRMQSNASMSRAYTASPAPFSSDTVPALPRPGYQRNQPGGPPSRFDSYDDYSSGRASPAPSMYPSRGPGGPNMPPRSATAPIPPRGPDGYDDYSNGRASPAPSMYPPRGPGGPNGRASPAPSMYPSRAPPAPQRSATGPVPPRGPGFPPQRNMTAPVPGPEDPYDYNTRPPTSNSQAPPRGGFGNGWNSDLENQRGGPGGPRY